MRFNPHKLRQPTQEPYAFCDGELHNDPHALTHYLAAQTRIRPVQSANEPYTRAYEKAQRLQRMAARARRDRQRCDR